MPIVLNGSVMKVGNSHALILPRAVMDNYDIERGDSLDIVVSDKGIFIPLESKKRNVNKTTEKWIKEVENK